MLSRAQPAMETGTVSARQAVVAAVFLSVLVLHLWLQFLGWRVHLGEPVPASWLPGPLAEHAWSILSFPLFVVIRRRFQQLYFAELLLVNSTLWAATISFFVSKALLRGQRR